MSVLKLEVYPIHFFRGNKSQLEAVRFFFNFYKDKYSQLCMEPKIINLTGIPNLFKFNLFNGQMTGKLNNIIFPNIIISKNKNNNARSDLVLLSDNFTRFAYFGALSYQYKLFLEHEKGVVVNTILNGMMIEDSLISRETTLTTLRALNLYLCLLLGDFSLQFSSISLENNGKFPLTKKYLALFCHNNQIPIEKSWSCDHDHSHHCGECPSCISRKAIFRMAKLKDNTIYRQKRGMVILLEKWAAKLRYLISNLFTGIKNDKYKRERKVSKRYAYLRIKTDIGLGKDNNNISILFSEGKRRKLINLNQSASFIFDFIYNKPRTIREIEDEIIRVYNVDKFQAKKDIKRFINEGLNRYLEWEK